MSDSSLSAMLARIDERTLNTDKKLDGLNAWMVAHERRVTTLEKWKEHVVGVVVGFQVASNAFFSWVFHVMSHKKGD